MVTQPRLRVLGSQSMMEPPKGISREPHRFFRYLTAALATLGGLMVIVSFTPLVSWWASGLAGSWNDPCGDTLIVLSGAPASGGVIAASTYWRCAYAVRAYRQCGVKKLILSGGSKSGAPIAISMDEFVESQGVPRQAIVLETRSTSTRENAIFTQPILSGGAAPPVLMTSDYHMFRARRVFEKLGGVVQPRPIPDALKRATNWQGRWPVFVDLVSETIKIFYYAARGWI
jgi:uncharacterized SAM-binding protein YcdF (DUF218 family)